MKRLINWLLGYVPVQAEGAFPERLLNLCAQHRLSFWRLRWQDETSFSFRVRLKDLKQLEEYAGRALCTLTVRRGRGLTAALLRWRKRWGFIIGLALAFLSVTVLSRFVLVVEVTGNEQVPTAVILSELQRLGVRPGVYGPGLERTALANEALIALPELSFMGINLYGTRIEVVVREAVPAPELLKEETPADILSVADGIVTHIHTAAGEARFRDGDTVRKGDVLISGDVTLRKPADSEYDIGKLVVRASGRVEARTWRTLEAVIPLTEAEKVYTGEEKTLFSGKILWWESEFFGNSGISYEKYDKIKVTRPLRLFGQEMPLSVTTVTLREYTLEARSADAAAARTLLEEELSRRLADILAETEGEVLRTDFAAREEDGLLTVTMLAECREQIGRLTEREGQTGRVHENGAPYEDAEE